MIKKAWREKGERGEKDFVEWLNKHNITFFSIDQTKKTRSFQLIHKVKSKRPDFVILMPSNGMFLVDIKNHKQEVQDGKSGYMVYSSEIESYKNLETQFTAKVWLVFCGLVNDWYWISIRDIQKFIGENKFFVPISDFKNITEDDDLNTVISKVVL